MSSFLQKLKVGSVAIDNSLQPDITGVVTRRIEKQYVTDPVEALGLTLSDDAEVISVEANSPSAKANIPLNFIIYDVNGEYVESKEDFYSLAANSLNLVVKLQSTAAVAEIIALILREEELACEESYKQESSRLNLDELSRTTPRYSFLSMEHPLFTRFIKRLESRRDALNQIKQRTKEAQEEQRRLLRKKIEEEMKNVLNDSDNAKESEEEIPANLNKVIYEELHQAAPPEVTLEKEEEAEDEHNEKDKFCYEQKNAQVEIKGEEHNKETTEESDSEVNMGDASKSKNYLRFNQIEVPQEGEVVPIESNVYSSEHGVPINDEKSKNDANDETVTVIPQVSAEELLALVGLPIEEQEQQNYENVSSESRNNVPDTSSGIVNPVIDDKVEFFTHPAEKYVLSTGEEVICSIKERRGPLPSPPPGRPPKIRKIKC